MDEGGAEEVVDDVDQRAADMCHAPCHDYIGHNYIGVLRTCATHPARVPAEVLILKCQHMPTARLYACMYTHRQSYFWRSCAGRITAVQLTNIIMHYNYNNL